eukprot:scaffold326709_cov59-Tisochrysis_lutea.AAC.1
MVLAVTHYGRNVLVQGVEFTHTSHPRKRSARTWSPRDATTVVGAARRRPRLARLRPLVGGRRHPCRMRGTSDAAVPRTRTGRPETFGREGVPLGRGTADPLHKVGTAQRASCHATGRGRIPQNRNATGRWSHAPTPRASSAARVVRLPSPSIR